MVTLDVLVMKCSIDYVGIRKPFKCIHLFARITCLCSYHYMSSVSTLQYSSRSDVQKELVTELRKMKDASTGFDSSTGGKQFFDSSQDAPAIYDVVNLSGDLWTKVGSYDPSPDQGLSIKKKIVWPGGSLNTPLDHHQPR